MYKSFIKPDGINFTNIDKNKFIKNYEPSVSTE